MRGERFPPWDAARSHGQGVYPAFVRPLSFCGAVKLKRTMLGPPAPPTSVSFQMCPARRASQLRATQAWQGPAPGQPRWRIAHTSWFTSAGGVPPRAACRGAAAARVAHDEGGGATGLGLGCGLVCRLPTRLPPSEPPAEHSVANSKASPTAAAGAAAAPAAAAAAGALPPPPSATVPATEDAPPADSRGAAGCAPEERLRRRPRAVAAAAAARDRRRRRRRR